MRKHLVSIAMITAVLILGWGCSKSDDDVNSENNQSSSDSGQTGHDWKWLPISDFDKSLDINFFGNDERPDWQAPSPNDFESWMIYQVTLPYELRRWASDDDLMSMSMSDEIRAVAHPAIKNDDLNQSAKYTYILKIFGDPEHSIRQSFVYRYYCAKLHRIFELHDIGHFRPETVYGVDKEYMLKSLTCESLYDIYPFIATVHLQFPADMTLYKGDYVAFFVGDECRGYYQIGSEVIDNKEIYIYAYGKEQGEEVTIYYFSNYNYQYTVLKPTFKIGEDVDGIQIK